MSELLVMGVAAGAAIVLELAVGMATETAVGAAIKLISALAIEQAAGPRLPTESAIGLAVALTTARRPSWRPGRPSEPAPGSTTEQAVVPDLPTEMASGSVAGTAVAPDLPNGPEPLTKPANGPEHPCCAGQGRYHSASSPFWRSSSPPTHRAAQTSR